MLLAIAREGASEHMIKIPGFGDHVRADWPITINGMLEGSTRSRDTDGANGTMRDVVEA